MLGEVSIVYHYYAVKVTLL